MEMATCEKCADVEAAVLGLENRVRAVRRNTEILEDTLCCVPGTPATDDLKTPHEPPKPVVLKERLEGLEMELTRVEARLGRLIEIAHGQLGALRLA